MWQKEWPAEEGAWWFYGMIPEVYREKSLVVMVVRKTADTPPKYFGFWNMHFLFEDSIQGQWLKIENPALPEY
jgi:hypothetical protein